MPIIDRQGSATVARHPIHPMLIPFPIAFFVGSLVSDIIYGVTDNPFWNSMATWLIAFGIVGALVAAIPGFVDYFTARFNAPGKRNATIHMIINLSIVVLYAINFYLRYNYPTIETGYVLSVIGVLGLMYSGWLGGEMVYVDYIGVTPIEELPADVREEERGRRAA